MDLQHDAALATLVGTLHVTPTNPGLLLQPEAAERKHMSLFDVSGA